MYGVQWRHYSLLHCRDGVAFLLKMPVLRITASITLLFATGRATDGGLMRTRSSHKVRKRNVPNENKRSCELTLSYIETTSGRVSFPELSTTQFPCLLVKVKAAPIQAWSDPEGSRKLRFPDLMTTAWDDGKVVSLTHQPPLPPGNSPGTHFC